MAQLSCCEAGSDTVSKRDQYWLAGRYDSDRVIVYFNPVKFGSPAPTNTTRIAPSVADGFFTPVALPGTVVSAIQRQAVAEPFRIGDRYDLRSR